MATKKSDLYVFTKAKELTKYIITVTEKSPKKYRFTLVTKLQNLCLDAIDLLYTANELPLGEERTAKQKESGVVLRKLGYFSSLAGEIGCILPAQGENASKLQAETLLFLGKWMASDEKRIKSKGSQKSDKEVSVQGNLFE